MNLAEKLTKLLEKTGRTRKWLAENTGNTAGTVKQYLNGSKESGVFYAKAKKLLEEELASQAGKAKPLQWDLLFETEEQFRKVDRASREVKSESLTAFCRATLLARAEEILRAKELRYPAGTVRPLKVAETLSGENGAD